MISRTWPAELNDLVSFCWPSQGFKYLGNIRIRPDDSQPSLSGNTLVFFPNFKNSFSLSEVSRILCIFMRHHLYDTLLMNTSEDTSHKKTRKYKLNIIVEDETWEMCMGCHTGIKSQMWKEFN